MTSVPQLRSLGDELMVRLDRLATFSSDPGALTRLYLTPEHKAAADQVMLWMAEAGMETWIDAVGSVVGRYEGDRADAKTLLIGSHIDTVRDAGKYDGSLGVLTAIAAVQELHACGERLPFAIEVLAFGDEEGVRFPSTLSGSRAIAGTFDGATLEARDVDGVRLADALHAFGGDLDAIAQCWRDPAKTVGYIEVHIEQGPVLEARGVPLGVVTAINGASRARIELTGKAGHAGTVPMVIREDALAAAAEMVLAVEATANRFSDMVATVGEMAVSPGAINVIPGRVHFSIDLRSPSDTDRAVALQGLRDYVTAIAARRRVAMQIDAIFESPSVNCDPRLIEALADAVQAGGTPALRLPSGAGHDAMAVAASLPVGMLFVRCRGGVSHHPTEAVTAGDAEVAIATLLRFLRSFDGRVFDGPS
ncbi:MAG: allantoate amidohydrolase [Geminicoccaceae bacterium]